MLFFRGGDPWSPRPVMTTALGGRRAEVDYVRVFLIFCTNDGMVSPSVLNRDDRGSRREFVSYSHLALLDVSRVKRLKGWVKGMVPEKLSGHDLPKRRKSGLQRTLPDLCLLDPTQGLERPRE